jgi:hypothetical protein
LQQLHDKDADLQRLRQEHHRTKQRTGPSAQSQLEAKLREQLMKKDRLVRALREAIKQLGACMPEQPVCVVLWACHCSPASVLPNASWSLAPEANLTHSLHACTEANLIESEKRHVDNTLERSARKEALAACSSASSLQRENTALSSELQNERKRLAQVQALLAERGSELQALSEQVCLLSA